MEMYLLLVGFHEDLCEHTFGLMKRGKYKPAANFTFKFIHEVICEGNPYNSGYILEVVSEGRCEDNSRYVVLAETLFYNGQLSQLRLAFVG